MYVALSLLLKFVTSTVSRPRLGEPPFAVDGKRVRITINNGRSDMWAAGEEEHQLDHTLRDTCYQVSHLAVEKVNRLK